MKEFNAYTEIHHSYREMERTMQTVLSHSDKIQDFFSTDGDIVFVACGSSYWMSLSAAAVMRYHTGKSAVAVKAADVVMFPAEHKNRYNRPIFVAPSRSGLSRELIDALQFLLAEYPGAKLFSITEYEKNEIENMADFNLSIPFANEISVCQTRSFNCLYTAFLTITAILSGSDSLISEMQEYFAAAPELYRQGEEKVKKMLDDLGHVDSLVTLGAGRQYGIVIEGAYISIEMAQLPANYYQTLEYRHGPIVTAKKGVLALICSGGASSLHYELQMAKEILATGAIPAMIWGEGNGWDGPVFSMGKAYLPEVVSLYFIFIAQSVAYYVALQRHVDPDNPGELTRFITY